MNHAFCGLPIRRPPALEELGEDLAALRDGMSENDFRPATRPLKIHGSSLDLIRTSL